MIYNVLASCNPAAASTIVEASEKYTTIIWRAFVEQIEQIESLKRTVRLSYM